MSSHSHSLTEFEVAGLKTAFTFADGHAYHDMPSLLSPVMNSLQEIWAEASRKSVPEMEETFKRSLSRIIRSPVLGSHEYFSLSPTASNSIDIAGTWLKSKGYKVGLLEPAFDNLYLLLKRRGVDISPISERDLADIDALSKKVKENHLKSIFVVSPNNPTGFQLDAFEFRALCTMCAENKITLILDTTFRFYSRAPYDEYQILNETGADFITIEDTGKTWPTQDTKVSLMAYSKKIAKEMREIYEEVYLCHSNFSVALLSHLIERTDHEGVDNVVWKEVDIRKEKLRLAINGTSLNFEPTHCPTSLPIAWLNCAGSGMSDLELVKKLEKSNVALLPGRFFFWNSQDEHTHNVRVSLLRSDAMFDKGLSALNQALLGLG